MQFKEKESEEVEFKKSTSLIKEAIISICAILNKHKKGKLYFGIKDNGEIVGQEVSQNTLRVISQTIYNNLEPKIFPEIKEIKLENKSCIEIIFEGNSVPYFAYGRSYIRVADEDKQINNKELENLFTKKINNENEWDLKICENAKIEDISDETINKFIELSNESKRILIKKEDKLTILKKLGLTKENKLTNAAIILFGNSPSKFFLNITVKCGRFRGFEKEEFIDLKDYNGNLFDNLESVENFLKNNLIMSAKIEGLYRKETWEIPLEAIREALINALIHRDYFSSGFVYVKLYDDKLIISNPGGFPEVLSIKDLYKEHESFPKNKSLAKVFYYTGLIDVWGRGSLNIVRYLKEAKLKKPLFEETAGYVRIIFQKKIITKTTPKTTPQTTPQTNEIILNLIKNNPKITKEEVAEKTGLTKDGIKYQIKKLKEKDLIRYIGSSKNGYWEIIKR